MYSMPNTSGHLLHVIRYPDSSVPEIVARELDAVLPAKTYSSLSQDGTEE